MLSISGKSFFELRWRGGQHWIFRAWFARFALVAKKTIIWPLIIPHDPGSIRSPEEAVPMPTGEGGGKGLPGTTKSKLAADLPRPAEATAVIGVAGTVDIMASCRRRPTAPPFPPRSVRPSLLSVRPSSFFSFPSFFLFFLSLFSFFLSILLSSVIYFSLLSFFPSFRLPLLLPFTPLFFFFHSFFFFLFPSSQLVDCYYTQLYAFYCTLRPAR